MPHDGRPSDSWRTLRAAGPSSDPGFAALKARVIARTGHHYYTDKDDLLFDRLIKRFKALGLMSANDYAAYLSGAGGAREWEALEAEITIGETFFFRYAEQFTALRDAILPDLIGARADERNLRLWSAGCSNGAEPYSLAILLYELLGPAWPQWDISILGTDISTHALDAARTAIFGRWAMRTTLPQDRDRWFDPLPAQPGATRDGAFRLKPEYRRPVRFELQNLLSIADGSAPRSPPGFDLILCRNVLIYFSAQTVSAIIRGLSERLAPGGWLLVGHAEPNPAFEAWLDPVVLPGTIGYRRRDGAERRAQVPPTMLDVPPQPVRPQPSRPKRPEAGKGSASRTPAADAPDAAPPVAPCDATLASIRALADGGETGEAWRQLQTAIAEAPTFAPLRYYEGLLAIGLGREAEAEQALRRALFLDRDFVMAHYHLGLLLIGMARPAQARRALENVLQLAQGLDPDCILAEGDGLDAGSMIRNAHLALRNAAGDLS